MEQGLQVSALPLGRHVEVCQPGLEGLLRGGEGCQVWEPCLTCSFLCSSQLGRLLGQFQALAVLGLRRERMSNSYLRVLPAIRRASMDHEPQLPYLQSSAHGQRLTQELQISNSPGLCPGSSHSEGSVTIKPGSEASTLSRPLCCVQASSVLQCPEFPESCDSPRLPESLQMQ